MEVIVTHYKRYITEQANALRHGKLGRKLDDTTVTPRPFQHYRDQVRQGEQLYMLLTGGWTPEAIAVNVTQQSEYEEFYGRYYAGHFTGIALYAIPNGLVEQ